MKKLILASAVSMTAALMATTAFAGMKKSAFEVTVTNTMADELIAPFLVTGTGNDAHIFDGNYVTKEAEEQILTGDPAKLAARIGDGVTVGHGSDGPPGVLLAPGKSITFTVETDAEELRVIAMVAPTKVPDNYLTAVVSLKEAMMMDDKMAKDTMADDKMKKDDMAKDAMMKKDEMAKDEMMKKDEMAMMDGGIVLKRFDIGHDEKSMAISEVEGDFGTITIKAATM